MDRQFRFLALLLCFSVTLPACGGAPGPQVARTYDRGRTAESLFATAAASGPVWVRLNGNPFGATAPERTRLADVVRRAMADAIPGREVVFTGDPTRSIRPDYFVSVVFGPAPTFGGDALCGTEIPGPLPPRAPGRLEVRAAFCAEGEAMSEAEGRVFAVAGPDDPRFHKLMYHLASALLVDLVPSQEFIEN
jgi:hypothetical protein